MNCPGEGSARPHHGFRIIRRNNQIEIPSALDYLPKVVEFIEKKLKKLGIKNDLIDDIAIAVSEAVTNAVVHGNKNDLSKRVRINLKADSSCVEVTVEDEGCGFDPECIQCPIEEENILKEAGRGIFILESLMDKVEFFYEATKGSRVKMVKLIA